jgi:hypothetical protein
LALHVYTLLLVVSVPAAVEDEVAQDLPSAVATVPMSVEASLDRERLQAPAFSFQKAAWYL